MSYGQQDTDLEFRWIFVGLPIAVLLGFIGFTLFRAPPKPDPANEKAYGCYQAHEAPSILLDQRGLVVDQSDMNLMTFRIDRAKIGIILVVDDPIDLRRTPVGYRFGRSTKGSGRSYPFLYRSGEKAYYTFDQNDLSIFQVSANDGTAFEYQRQPLDKCKRR